MELPKRLDDVKDSQYYKDSQTPKYAELVKKGIEIAKTKDEKKWFEITEKVKKSFKSGDDLVSLFTLQIKDYFKTRAYKEYVGAPRKLTPEEKIVEYLRSKKVVNKDLILLDIEILKQLKWMANNHKLLPIDYITTKMSLDDVKQFSNDFECIQAYCGKIKLQYGVDVEIKKKGGI